MHKVEIIWNHNDSRARVIPSLAEGLIRQGRARYADSPPASVPILPPGYSIEEPGGGWFRALDNQGNQIGKAQRSWEAACDLCVSHAKG